METPVLNGQNAPSIADKSDQRRLFKARGGLCGQVRDKVAQLQSLTDISVVVFIIEDSHE